MNNQLQVSPQQTDVDELLKVMERVLPGGRIGAIERFVVAQSWLGRTYHEMAENSGYTSDYIKEIGSELWQDLSVAMGERVTKKNLHLLLKQGRYQTVKDRFALEHLLPENFAKFPQLSVEPLQFPDGALSLNSPFYIKRPPIENLVFAELQQPGCVIGVKAPRQFGKTSLLHRMRFFAQGQRYKSVYLDFQEADEKTFADLNQFLRWFCINITTQLGLHSKLDDYWDEEMGSKMSCKIYFERYLLQQFDSPLVLLLDEVNRILSHPNIALDFLPMLRSWHEQAKYVQTWQKLRMVVAHATDIYIPLKLNQSPFNVGTITLPHFTIAQIQELAARYGFDWQNSDQMHNAMSLRTMVGGHPYLTNLAFYHLQQGEMTITTLLETAPTQTGIYRHHLQSYLVLLHDEPVLATALRQVVMANESVQIDALAAYKLESLGLIQLQGSSAHASCELYRQYFRSSLLSY